MKPDQPLCPCSSGQPYEICCKPFHHGQLPPTALQLMRSRFSAYARCLPEYIIETTHPASPQYHAKQAEWLKQIAAFCRNTQFKQLEILHSQENGSFAAVTFVAHLSQNKKDLSFTERSYFERIRGKWLYRSGQLAEGHAPNLITTQQLRLLPLAYYDNPILRKVADPILEITPEVRTLVEEMIETMDACDGLGLAAPQVHHCVRLFVMRKPFERDGKIEQLGEVKVLINPILSDLSSETWRAGEGCLSIPSIHGDVDRHKEITIEYTDLQGLRHQERAAGWEAKIMQHEIDHLNGILFLDRLSPEERQPLEPLLKALKNRIHDGTEM